MELTNIKDLFREKEKYQGRKVTVGGWAVSYTHLDVYKRQFLCYAGNP